MKVRRFGSNTFTVHFTDNEIDKLGDTAQLRGLSSEQLLEYLITQGGTHCDTYLEKAD